MGLQLNLPKTDNYIGEDFLNAYWTVENISFNSVGSDMTLNFELKTYASRRAKYLQSQAVPNSEIKFGGSLKLFYEPCLHIWKMTMSCTEVFQDGIPISIDEQKRKIYNYIKEYTHLPFVDVFEEE